MENIEYYAEQFRNAIECAQKNGETDNIFFFEKFPRGCCGFASDFLGHFLLEKGIKTYYICGNYHFSNFDNPQSHAWLITQDKTIIDITGDQFKNESIFLNYDKSVYVGKTDDFHNLFEYDSIHTRKSVFLDKLNSFSLYELKETYKKIVKYI